jgi:hypothetical protein
VVSATAAVDDQLAEHVATPAMDGGGVVSDGETDHAGIIDNSDIDC